MQAELRALGDKRQRISNGRFETNVLGQQFGQRFAAPGDSASREDAAGVVFEKAECLQRIVSPAIDGDRWQRLRGPATSSVVPVEPGMSMRAWGFAATKNCSSERNNSPGGSRARTVTVEHPVTGVGIQPESPDCRVNIAVQAEHDILREVVEQCRRLLEEQR